MTCGQKTFREKLGEILMNKELAAKVESAKAIIDDAVGRFGLSAIYGGTSGGKDSVCVRHLFEQEHGPNSIEWVHNAKGYPDTHPYTVNLLYAMAVQGQDVNFVHRSHMENHVDRCGYQAQIDGSRRAEYDRTVKCTTVMVDGLDINRKDMPPILENSMFGLTFIYPIYNWSDQDVFDYLESQGIYLTPEYTGEHNLIKVF